MNKSKKKFAGELSSAKNNQNLFNIPILHSLPEEMLESEKEYRFIGNFIQNAAISSNNITVLEVHDTSFEKRGLYPGDFVLASRETHPEAGDLVIASIGEEQFVAIYHPQQDRIRLDRDANGHHLTIVDPLLPDFTLHGKIIHVFRKLG